MRRTNCTIFSRKHNSGTTKRSLPSHTYQQKSAANMPEPQKHQNPKHQEDGDSFDIPIIPMQQHRTMGKALTQGVHGKSGSTNNTTTQSTTRT
eukprot:scaffold7927_cov59-Attheya_sp.AAC.2